MQNLNSINKRILDLEEKLQQAYSAQVTNFIIQQLRDNLNYLKENRNSLLQSRKKKLNPKV